MRKGWKIKPTRSRAAGIAVLTASAVAATLALAATPEKGAVYFGDNGMISFKASVNGKSLSHFSGPFFSVPFCGVPATPYWQAGAKIKGGRFTITMIGHPVGSKYGPVITGRFTAGGGVKGKLEDTEKCPSPTNPTGPDVVLKHRTASWSGTSQPQGKGSGYCLDHSHTYPPPTGNQTLTDIIDFDATCKTVYGAIDAGTLTPAIGSAPPSFTTPGWTCQNKGTGQFACSNGKARFTFAFSL